MRYNSLTSALVVCSVLLLNFTPAYTSYLRNPQATLNTPSTQQAVYKYPNGTVVPQDQLQQLLSDPNVRVQNNSNNIGAASQESTAAEVAPAPTIQDDDVAEADNQSQETDNAPNQLLAFPENNTSPVADETSNAVETQEYNQVPDQNLPETQAQTNVDNSAETRVYKYPNGTIVPEDQLQALLSNPNVTVKDSNGAEVDTPDQVNTTTPATTAAPAPTEGVYTYPNGTVVPQDKLQALLNNPNVTVKDSNESEANQGTDAIVEQPEAQIENNDNAEKVYQLQNGTIITEKQLQELLKDPNANIKVVEDNQNTDNTDNVQPVVDNSQQIKNETHYTLSDGTLIDGSILQGLVNQYMQYRSPQYVRAFYRSGSYSYSQQSQNVIIKQAPVVSTYYVYSSSGFNW